MNNGMRVKHFNKNFFLRVHTAERQENVSYLKEKCREHMALLHRYQ